MTATWLFNHGFGHRGVWHLVSETYVKTEKPYDRIDSYDIYDYHTKKCASNKREYVRAAVGYGYRIVTGTCDCGHTGMPTGEKTVVTRHHDEWQGRWGRIACNQVRDLPFGDHLKASADFKDYYQKPGKFEITYTFVEGTEAYVSDTPPPGPVCVRCKKKNAQNITGDTGRE